MCSYLLTGVLAGLVVACGLDDTHIYDMFFCYLLTGVLAGLVVACVLDDIHIYDMFFLLFINKCPS
jgi:sugar phosphate permease